MMDKRYLLLLTGGFLLAGVGLGLLLYFPLPEAVAAPEPTVSPTPRADMVWIIPTQANLETAIPSKETAKTGAAAPDFALEDRDGNPVRLSDMRGSVVVINFWASWCPPCREEMPALQQLASDFAQDGLVVLGVNTAYADNRRAAEEFVDELDLTFPILFDETGEISEGLYSVLGLPTTYWVDRQGTVRQIKVGVMSQEQMVELAEFLLLP